MTSIARASMVAHQVATDADFASLAEAWPGLPQHTKQAILALANVSHPGPLSLQATR